VSPDLVVLVVLFVVAALVVAGQLGRVPYPILLVAGGAGLGFLPGMPDGVQLSPDLVFLILLPPLLYAAAFFSSLRDLQANLGTISLLAVGLVAFTTVGLAVVAHAMIGLPWGVAFTLGAILAPTDAVSATAIASRVGAPRRFVTVIEGESLINDSTALIAYRFAVGAVVTGSFGALSAGGHFVLDAAGGVALGLAVGWLVAQVRIRIEDAPTESTISLVTPYFAYLPAQALGVSAILSAVTAGVYLGWRSPQLISPSTRIEVFAVWRVLQFLLNAALFTLLGLELPHVLRGISDRPALTLAAYAALVAGATIAIRFLWVFPATYGPRAVSRRLREREPRPPVALTFITAWAGMRGAVSLAAALAVPVTVAGGALFPHRDLVIFLVYSTIATTLVLEGLTLPWLIRRLGLDEEDGGDGRRESKARLRAAEAAIARIDELGGEDWTRGETIERVRAAYDYRRRRFAARFADDGTESSEFEDRSEAYQRIVREVLEAQRRTIVQMRNEGRISDDIMHRIERDLDLEELRLEA
jgi:Na+/H+ antiporter